MRERTREILQQVSEGQSIRVTHRGKVMAHLVPPPRKATPEAIERALKEADDLITLIGQAQSRPSTLSDWRREW